MDPPPPQPAAWHLYMPGVDFDPADRRAQLVAALVAALAGPAGWQLVKRVRAYLPQARRRPPPQPARTRAPQQPTNTSEPLHARACMRGRMPRMPRMPSRTRPCMPPPAAPRRAAQEYVLPVDYEQLLALSGGCADLEAAVELEPAEALACVGLAVHEVRRPGKGARGLGAAGAAAGVRARRPPSCCVAARACPGR